MDACLQLRCLATDFLYLRAFVRSGPHRNHSFPCIVASIRVYRAVAWHRIDQIRYNIFTLLTFSFSFSQIGCAIFRIPTRKWLRDNEQLEHDTELRKTDRAGL
jgi:accessory gene regulator protein AgrB